MDLLRIACSVLVLLSHLRTFPNTGLSSSTFSVGAVGVDFFFILSGWSIAAMFEKYGSDKNWPWKFMLNRFLRVCIPYFFSLLLYLWLTEKVHQPIEIIHSFLFLKNYNYDFSVWGIPILPPGWSLNYEVLFYFGIFLAAIIGRLSYFPLAVFLLVFSGLFVPISFIWLELIAGYYIYIYRDYVYRLQGVGSLLKIIIIAFLLVAIFSTREIAGDFLSAKRIIYWGIPSVLLFMFFFTFIPIIQRFDFFTKKINFSFSLYLMHWIVLVWYSSINFWGVAGLYFMVVSFTFVFYILVERPMHILSKKIVHQNH